MFRALLFPSGEKIIMKAPIAITLLPGKEDSPAVPLSIQSEAIFTTAVGHSSKRTLGRWHVTTPQEIVEHMLDLVKDDTCLRRRRRQVWLRPLRLMLLMKKNEINRRERQTFFFLFFLSTTNFRCTALSLFSFFFTPLSTCSS